jgi:hypothetical protein
MGRYEAIPDLLSGFACSPPTPFGIASYLAMTVIFDLGLNAIRCFGGYTPMDARNDIFQHSYPKKSYYLILTTYYSCS